MKPSLWRFLLIAPLVGGLSSCTLSIAQDGTRTYGIDGAQAARAAAVVLDSGK